MLRRCERVIKGRTQKEAWAAGVSARKTTKSMFYSSPSQALKRNLLHFQK